MEIATKSLPKSLKSLVNGLEYSPRKVQLEISSDAFVVVNTASFYLSEYKTASMKTVDPESRGSYMGDDGESWYETFTEFHGPVALRYDKVVTILVPGVAATETPEQTVARLHKEEGTVQAEAVKKPVGNEKVLVCLDAFVEYLTALLAEHHHKVELDFGRKYVKVVAERGGSKHVHSFIDLQTGDVLKAASWNAPAKHARGTIMNNNPAEYGVDWTGANYIR